MKTIKNVISVRDNWFAILVFLFFAAVTVEPCTAQDQSRTARGRIAVTTIKIKPDMVSDFQNMVNDEVNPAIAKGGIKWQDIWQPATFGEGFEFILVSPIENFAQYDSPGPLAKGLGREGYAAWAAKSTKMVSSLRTCAYEMRSDLSYEPEMTAPPKMAVVNFVSVAPGRNTEFENFIKGEWLSAVKKSGIRGYFVHQLVFGGDINEYMVVALHENFAELDKGQPAARVLGQESMTKLMQKLPVGVVTHQERIVARFNAELSYRPAPAMAK